MRTIAFTCLIFLYSFAYGQTEIAGNQFLELDDYAWEVIESDHFMVYFDGNSEYGANQAMNFAINNLKKIEEKIGFRLSGKIEIVYYNSLYDLNRSFLNQGSDYKDLNKGGLTDLRNNLFSVYQSNSGKDLMIQIKRGIAGVLINDMIYEGTVQERIKYQTLLHLPVWFVDGLTEYIASGWDEDADDQLRSALEMDLYNNMNLVAREAEILAGRSIWKFIDESKGELAIPRILYLVRLTRKVESSVYFVFNWSTKELFSEWESYFRSNYSIDSRRRMPLNEEPVSQKFLNGNVSSVKISPDGDKIAFTTYNEGNYRLVVYNRNSSHTGIKKERLKWLNFSRNIELTSQVWFELKATSGVEIYDPTKMVLEWKDNSSLYLMTRTTKGSDLSIVSKEGTEVLHHFDELENVSKLVFDDQQTMLVSATGRRGGAIYTINTGSYEISEVLSDSTDFSEPSFDVNGLGFYFTRTSMVKEDSFYKRWNSDVGYFRFIDRSVTWIANDPKVDEFCPLRYGRGAIGFLSTESGIVNAYLFDGTKTVGLTDYQHNIITQSNARKVSLVVEMLSYNGTNHFYVSEYVSDIDKLSSFIYAEPTYFATSRDKIIPDLKVKKDAETIEPVADEPQVFFQTDFPNDDIDSILAVHAKTKLEKDLISRRDYGLKWTPTYVVAQLHNGMLNTDRFAAYRVPQASFTNPFGAHVAVVLEDVHKSKLLTGGVKTNTNFYRLEFYVNYVNRKKRLQKSIDVWRNSNLTASNDMFYFRNVSNDHRLSFKYPLSQGLSVGSSIGYRRDKRIFLSSGTESLTTGNLEQKFTRLELNATLDKRRNRDLNTYEGWFISANTEFQVKMNDVGNFGANKLDIRYSKKLQPLLYWANRIEINNSYGRSQMRYFIGGMENWINPAIGNSIYLSDQHTSYMVPVFGVRGFSYNARNGSTSMTYSTELRYKIGKRMMKRSGQSNFIENMILTSFIDLGSAFYGRSPYDRVNPLNSRTIETGALLIKVYNPKDPLIYGFGGGIRTSLFNYYLKMDLAFGRDNGEWLDRIHYFTIGMDF